MQVQCVVEKKFDARIDPDRGILYQFKKKKLATVARGAKGSCAGVDVRDLVDVVRRRAEKYVAQRRINATFLLESPSTERGGCEWTVAEILSITRSDDRGRVRFLLEHVDGRHRVVMQANLLTTAGRAILNWCVARPNASLDHETALRWGLYHDEVSGEEWSVDAVVFVPHDTILRSAQGVRCVQGPAYYARNHDEPHWGWHEVRLHTLDGPRLCNALGQAGIWKGGTQFSLQYDSLTDANQIVPRAVPRAIDALDEYCLQHPFVPVRVSSPGARAATPDTDPFLLKEDRMLICNTKVLCLQASLCNAIALVISEEYATEVMLKEALPPMLSFVSAAKWTNTHAKWVILNRVRFGAEHCESKVEWLVAQSSGVFLVRLRTRNVDHVVCVDATRRMILDSVEQFPMSLSVKALRCCVGSADGFERVMEVRKVEELRRSSEGNRCSSKRRHCKRRKVGLGEGGYKNLQ